MILRELPEGLLCIHQLDHSRLAGRLADAWGGPAVPAIAPREPVVAAIARHDAGWPRLDAEPVWNADTGRPHTFRTHVLSDQLGVAARSVEEVAAIDPYAGWLVSRHFASFHERSDDPSARAWIEREASRRAELLRRAAARLPQEVLEPRVLEANFDWLQLLDAVSLALCSGWDAWSSRRMALGYDGRTGSFRYESIASAAGPSVLGSLDPWPFAAPRVPASAPGRMLDGYDRAGPDELARAWSGGRQVRVEAVLTRE